MKDKNEIKDEKLEKVSGGAVWSIPCDVVIEPTDGGDEEQKFINIDGARPKS